MEKAESIYGFNDWKEITPDRHHDWINQRSEEVYAFYPIGSQEAKKGILDDSIFKLFSKGVKTARDAHLYNYSREACAKNARRMTETYLAALADLEQNPDLTPEEAARRHNTNIKWDDALRANLQRGINTSFDECYIHEFAYRPFVATNCYADNTFVNSKYLMNQIFPHNDDENTTICVTGMGSAKTFSALITNTIPDLHFIDTTQCFPRWHYPKPSNDQDEANELPGIDGEADCIDNISDTALHAFQEQYSAEITKDDIFDYVYGIFHAKHYRDEFANNLAKQLPRIPFAPDFDVFAEAGNALATLHLGYKTCEEYPLQLVYQHEGEPQSEHFKLDNRGMRFGEGTNNTELIINEHITLAGIPEEAHQYVVNGRTPLEWFIDQYKIQTKNGIVNDPNGWFANPEDLVRAIKRIVYMSVESVRIIDSLSSQPIL